MTLNDNLLVAKKLRDLSLWQRRVKLVIRGGWLAIASYLIVRATVQHQYPIEGYGDFQYIPTLIFLFFLVASFYHPKKLDKYLWKVDATLKLKEQLSPLFNSPPFNDSPIHQNYLKNISHSVKQAKGEISKYGWQLKSDLLSLLIVLILSAITFLSSISFQPIKPIARPMD